MGTNTANEFDGREAGLAAGPGGGRPAGRPRLSAAPSPGRAATRRGSACWPPRTVPPPFSPARTCRPSVSSGPSTKRASPCPEDIALTSFDGSAEAGIQLAAADHGGAAGAGHGGGRRQRPGRRGPRAAAPEHRIFPTNCGSGSPAAAPRLPPGPPVGLPLAPAVGLPGADDPQPADAFLQEAPRVPAEAGVADDFVGFLEPRDGAHSLRAPLGVVGHHHHLA